MKKRFLLGTIILSVVLLFSSCYIPSPLYGTWQDNSNNKIIFNTDGSFTSQVAYNTEVYEYTGTYTVIDNVIIFNIVSSSDETTATPTTKLREWSLSGAILKLHKWKDDESDSSELTLYHISR